MPDLDDAIASLVADADRMPLAGAPQLRHVGDARNRRQIALSTGVAVLVVAAIASVTAAVLGAHRPAQPASPLLTQSVTIVESPTPPATPQPTAPVACAADDFAFDSS